ncbi:DNA (cytosine-5-)-methyltransferase [Algoriphagus kandeliae]|uniref:Cytosine-specific methyltransferase n=1 Tax=Algoriphagus kandeliae TaxID=2562278 RepID=A0A4Y9R1T2_9BACT|nr:DNA (cytosine-5-)-methyltransferase [Algoriphagus kandeliae]TFV97523.1 DNA (cytosine-5-)-methyltransferase [Algoriphagus kandeliae]
MKLKENITIEEVLGKKFKVRTIQPLDYGEAALTHYLHNSKNPESRYYKEEAINQVKKFLESTESKEEIDHEVAEDALQGLLFDFQDEIPFKAPENPQFKFIDLFAGIGGFRLALQGLGGKCVFTSEWDENAKKTYKTNFGEIPFGDITKEKTKEFIPKDYDILCAGFPCQAFSVAGYRKGFADTRGTLFFEIEKIAEKHTPKVLFLENVKNLVGHDEGRTFETIFDILENKLNYKVHAKVLNSMTHANVPQNRERIFIVALHKDKVERFNAFAFPEEIPLTRTIHDCLEEGKLDEKYYYHPNHPYYKDLSYAMTNPNTIYQWRRVYVRENKNNVCPTLTANMGSGGHNVPLIKDQYGIRKLTPAECFAFQGYPIAEYKLPEVANSHLYKQAGNSVTVPLIRRIGERILDIL